MATPKYATNRPGPAPSQIGTDPAAPRPSLIGEMARLAALHAEAEETARLANLLGRSAYAAGALALAVIAATALAWPVPALGPLAAWLVLMGVALAGLARAYAQTIRAPFERAPLAAFSEDLRALLTYAGFAWGAGAFLVLPAETGPLAAAAFAVVPAALVATALRAAGPSLVFLAPAAGLSAFAMVLRPLPGGVLGAALAVLATGIIAAICVLMERQAERHQPALAELPLA